jgi:protein-tyrosine-phosphatase
MAEAIARHIAPGIIEASSAGVEPLGYISEHTRTVLREAGVSCERQSSKALRQTDAADADLVVNISGREALPIAGATPVEHWEIADPFGCDIATYRKTRDEIARRVKDLVERLRADAGRRRSHQR